MVSVCGKQPAAGMFLAALVAATVLALWVAGCGGAATPTPTGGSEISGRIVDAQNPTQPIGNAYVYIPAAGSSSARQGGTGVVAETTSDAQGNYTLTGVPAGQWTLIARPPAGSGLAETSAELTVPEGGDLVLTMTVVDENVQAQIDHIDVTPNPAEVEPSTGQQFAAVARDAEDNDLGLAVTWTLKGPIGTIDSDGLFTAGASELTGTVVASVGGKSGEATVGIRTVAPPGTKIVFVNHTDSLVTGIYTCNAGGTDINQVIDGPAQEEWPAWPPDHSAIAFQTNRDGEPNWEIYLVTPVGGGLTNLTQNPEEDLYPDWTSDGLGIAFSSRRGGNRDIYTMDADGSNPGPVFQDPADDRHPCWSPDNAKIVFDTDRDAAPSGALLLTFPDGVNYEIYVVESATKTLTRLTNDPATDWHPSWSPDGNRIAFKRGGLEAGNYDIWVMDADGGNQTKVTSLATAVDRPRWSADSQKLIFSADTPAGGTRVYTVKLDGTELTAITPANLTASHPCW